MTAGSPGPAGPQVTVRRGAGDPGGATPARRLILTAAEWAALVAGWLTDVPSEFAAAEAAGQQDDAVASLIRRGIVLPADGRKPAGLVPAVAVNLEVLRRPVLTVLLDVTGRGGGRHGWFGVASGLVAGVLTLPSGRVELSLAPEVRLRAELARAVPDASVVLGPGFPEESSGTAAAPSGRLPLALLDDLAPSPDTASAPSPGEVALAEELLRRTAGSLSCLVLGRAGDGVAAGQVSWLATDAGWVGLRPVVDGSPRRLVDVVPVQSADLGGWVAPAVAALLEGSVEPA